VTGGEQLIEVHGAVLSGQPNLDSRRWLGASRAGAGDWERHACATDWWVMGGDAGLL
jgi:hypothetical protein